MVVNSNRPTRDPELFLSMLERRDFQDQLLGPLRGFDIKMLMDSCTRLRHDQSLQSRLFKSSKELKVKDLRVLQRFRKTLSSGRKF